jgi:hypothetical protein
MSFCEAQIGTENEVFLMGGSKWDIVDFFFFFFCCVMIAISIVGKKLGD